MKRHLQHAKRRVAQGQHNANVIHHESLSRNERLGVFITAKVGTMWAAYAFVALSFIALPSALHSGDPLIIVTWVSQSFLQLVLLPVIIVGQNAQSRHQEIQTEVDHHITETLLKLQEEQMVILRNGQDTKKLAQAILDQWDGAGVAKRPKKS